MGMTVKLYFDENKQNLNVVVSSDDAPNESSKSNVIADVVLPLSSDNERSGCVPNKTVLSGKMNNGIQFPTSVGISSSPNQKSETLEEYYIIEKVVGKRYNSVTDQYEYLLELKNCVPVCNPWTSVAEPIPIPFHESGLLYVQKPKTNDCENDSNVKTICKNIPENFQYYGVHATAEFSVNLAENEDSPTNKAQSVSLNVSEKLAVHSNYAESGDHFSETHKIIDVQSVNPGEWCQSLSSFTSSVSEKSREHSHYAESGDNSSETLTIMDVQSDPDKCCQSLSSNASSVSAVTGHQKSSRKRVRKKLNACLYCQDLPSKLYQHYVAKHQNEKEVQILLSFPKHSKQRKAYLNLMHGKANQNYNRMELNKQEELISKRLPIQVETDASLLRCVICNHMHVKTNIERHLRACKRRCKLVNTPESCESTVALRDLSKGMDPVDILLSVVNETEIKEFIRDPVMLHYVKSYFSDPNDEFKKKEIQQDIRYAWRYLLSFREVSTNSSIQFDDCFKLSYVGHILDAFIAFNNYTHPDMVERLGNCLMHIYNMLCTSNTNENYKKSFRSGRLSFSSIWKTVIHPEILVARTRLIKNSKNEFPNLELIQEFSIFVNTWLQILISSDIVSYTSYRALCCFLVTKITLLNYLRGPDLTLMTLNEFHNKIAYSKNKCWTSCRLTAYEKEIAEDIVILISDNGSKKVGILTPDIINGIEKIISCREIVNIPNESVYVFASKEQGTKPSYYTSLRLVLGLIDRDEVPLLYAANFQKYISTQMQWVNMTEKQRWKWSKHLSNELKTSEILSPKVFSPIPVLLMATNENIQISKPLHKITEEDTREFIKLCCDRQADTPGSLKIADSTELIFAVYLNGIEKDTVSENEDEETESAHSTIEHDPKIKLDNLEIDTPQAGKRIRWTPMRKRIIESQFPEVLLDPTVTVTEKKLLKTIKKLRETGLVVRPDVLRTMIYNNYQKTFRQKMRIQQF